jgi:hypothetical protein
MIEMTFFYSSRGWKSKDPRRVASSGGADSMLRFQLEKGGNRTKRCWKMKQRQRARLVSMRKKCDTTQRRGDVVTSHVLKILIKVISN